MHRLVAPLALFWIGCDTPSAAPPDAGAPAARDTVGMDVVAPDLRPIEVAVSLPRSVDAGAMVKALSTAIYRAVKACGGSQTALPFGPELQVSFQAAGRTVTATKTGEDKGARCVAGKLEGTKLPEALPPEAFDVHLLLRPKKAPTIK